MTVPVIPSNRPPREYGFFSINFPFDSGDVDFLSDGMFREVGVTFPFDIKRYALTGANNAPDALEVKLMWIDAASYDPAAFAEASTALTRPTLGATDYIVGPLSAPAAWKVRYARDTFLRAVIVGSTTTLRAATLVLDCEKR